MSKKSYSRRTFITGVGAGMAALGGAALLGGCTPKTEANAVSNSNDTWDEETDVVVVGGGALGLAAAIEAQNGGAKVVLLEKTAMLGGDCVLSKGIVLGSGSETDKKIGIDVPIEDVEAEGVFVTISESGVLENDMELAQFTIEHAGETYDWLVSQGVEFDNPDGLMNPPEANPYTQLPIYHQVKGGGGGLSALADVAINSGVEVKLSTPGIALIQNDEGRVVGVVAKSGSSTIRIKADKGVILGTGGYAGNNAMRVAWDPRTDGMDAIGLKTNTGDGLIMASKVGAAYRSDRNSGVFLASVNTNTEYLSYWVYRDGGILVGKDGKRFTSELRDRLKEMPLAVNEKRVADGTDFVCLVSSDSEAIQNSISNGAEVFSANTIEELASALGMDAQWATGLKNEIEHYNAMCASGYDEDFGKTESLIPVEAPFYAAKIKPHTTITGGGVTINNQSQILRFADPGSDEVMEPIPGLYGGGNLAPYFYHFGYAISNAITRGRVAGQEILKG